MKDNDQLIERMAAEVAGMLLEQTPLDELLLGIGKLATAAIPHCEDAAVTLENEGEVISRTATSERIEAVDSFQYEIEDGPCIEASRSRKSVLIKDMESDRRWPRFADFARSRGVTSTYSIPMRQGDKVVGVVNLYSSGQPFGRRDEGLGLLFAQEASTLMAHAAALAKTQELLDNLTYALEARNVIGTAVGMRMQRDDQTAKEALDDLEAESERSHIRLRDVAERRVEAFESELIESRDRDEPPSNDPGS